MRRTGNTLVSPTIGIATIGTGKIGFGPACAAAGAASAMPAAVMAAAAVSTLRREVFVMVLFPGLGTRFLGLFLEPDDRRANARALRLKSRCGRRTCEPTARRRQDRSRRHDRNRRATLR